jgi:hypothetical protein
MMGVSLKTVFEEVGYSITGGEEHGWQEVFPYGRFIDWEGNFSTVFSSKTQEVFQLEFYDTDTNTLWTWVRPESRAEYKKKLESLFTEEDDFNREWCTDPGTVLREYKIARGTAAPGVFTSMDLEGHPV